MKILVILRGQPRANANLYHKNLKALDEWDADVDVILDGVTDMYTVIGKLPDSAMKRFAPSELINTNGFHKDTTTILSNIKIANEWPTKTKIEVARLRELNKGIKYLQKNGLLEFLEKNCDTDKYEGADSYENIVGQYFWFFDPPVDYRSYDILLTIRQDHLIREKFDLSKFDINKFTFITDGEHVAEDGYMGYSDNVMGFTQPGKIHDILEIINNPDTWAEDTYFNDGDGNGPYSVKGTSWTLQLFQYKKTNHKLMFGIQQLLQGLYKKIHIEPANLFAFNHLPMPDLTHGRTKNDDPIFDYYYDEEQNQKYKFYKK